MTRNDWLTLNLPHSQPPVRPHWFVSVEIMAQTPRFLNQATIIDPKKRPKEALANSFANLSPTFRTFVFWTALPYVTDVNFIPFIYISSFLGPRAVTMIARQWYNLCGPAQRERVRDRPNVTRSQDPKSGVCKEPGVKFLIAGNPVVKEW